MCVQCILQAASEVSGDAILRTPIIVNTIGEDDNDNEGHVKRLRSVMATYSRHTEWPDLVRLP